MKVTSNSSRASSSSNSTAANGASLVCVCHPMLIDTRSMKQAAAAARRAYRVQSIKVYGTKCFCGVGRANFLSSTPSSSSFVVAVYCEFVACARVLDRPESTLYRPHHNRPRCTSVYWLLQLVFLYYTYARTGSTYDCCCELETNESAALFRRQAATPPSSRGSIFLSSKP